MLVATLYFLAGSRGSPFDRDLADARADRGLRVDFERQARDLREAAGAVFDLRDAVLQRRPDIGARDLDEGRRVAERQFGQDVAAGQLRARRILLVGADAAAVGDGDVAAGRIPDRVGDEVADGGFLRAHGCRRGCRVRSAVVPISISSSFDELALVAFDHRQHLRVGIDGRRIVHAEARRPGHLAVLALARDGGDEIDRGDEIPFLVRFDHHGLAVIADGEVVVVAGQQHVDEARAHDRVVHVAVGMSDRDDDVGALLAQISRLAS